MAQASATNPAAGVKLEEDVAVKAECVVCGECASGAAPLEPGLLECLRRHAGRELGAERPACRACLALAVALCGAEAEYIRLKAELQAILDRSALHAPPASLKPVKQETFPSEDSDDEPLSKARTEKLTKTDKKKKKLLRKGKRKVTEEGDSWECEECGVKGDSGGEVALSAHRLTVHDFTPPIKLEDGSQSPFENGLDDSLELEFEVDDDDDNTFTVTSRKKTCRRGKKGEGGVKKEPKVMHYCDQCNARYSSVARLVKHKLKHDGSKPPYICEVCGAHYKHRRACDIHIAMHKGISDWKCEECNKLFPSKNALQRHNNIHTGKLNYQCDLCGKSFIHTSSFKMHKLAHSGVKPHQCGVCGLALMTRSHLKRHERIHSGEKRHECAVCGKRFSERYNLAAHARAHDPPPAAPSPAAAPAATPRRYFRCGFCPERFERRFMLERHTAAEHGRTLERPPPTPRNTMSKLLKQRAQRPPPAPAATPPPAPVPTKPVPPGASKLLAQLTGSGAIISTGSWTNAYTAEFGLRDYSH